MTLNTVGFIGFPDIKMKPVKIPDYFFTELLPQIDDLAELKLTLHCFWLLNEQEGELRYLREQELREDETLLRSLTTNSDLRMPQAALDDALQRALARNTLLKLEIETDQDENETDELHSKSKIPNPKSKTEAWYFINTVKGRQTLALIRQGKLDELRAAIPDEARLRVQRPNIYILYEQNVGLMTPILADKLRDLEKSYPPAWIEEAFDIAVSRNKRHLRYIENILKRWETEGKEGESREASGRDPETRRRSYIPDEFSDVLLG